MIGPEDEQIHAIGSDPHWQESFYFNWADPEQRAFTLARIGFRFNQQKIDGLIVSIREGEPDLVYPAANLPHQGSWSDQSPEKGMRSRGFTVTMEEPLRRWRLQLRGPEQHGRRLRSPHTSLRLPRGGAPARRHHDD